MPSALLMAALLGGCAADEVTRGPAGGIARTVGVATSPTEPADFVKESRPANDPRFLPVGVTPPSRETPRRNEDALKKLETELDADRNRSRGFATRPAPKSTYDGTIPARPKPVPPELLPD